MLGDLLIFKILQMFLLPSVWVMIFVLLGFILFFLKQKKSGKAFILLGIIFYYIFSLSFVSDFLLFPLEKEYFPIKQEELGKAEIIVLLLGGKESNVLRGSEVLRLSHLSGNRMQIIISGTDPLNPKSEEASAVRGFFISRGIPEQNIKIEGKSRNTWENVRNVKEILGNNPFFLITSAYHMKRAINEFEKLKSNPIPAPTDFKRKGEYNLFDIFPDPQALKKSDLAVWEHLGRAYYKLLYLWNNFSLENDFNAGR